MTNFTEGRDCENPHRGREAYVSAKRPCKFNKPSGKLQDIDLPDACEEGEEIELPETPACMTVIQDEESTQLVYDELTGMYSGAGMSGSYDPILGWAFTTPSGYYRPTNKGLNPSGIYCDADGFITVVPCDKAPTEPIPDCVTIKLISDGYVKTTFSKSTDTLYVSDDNNGTLTFNDDKWTYTINGEEFQGPTADDPRGVYELDDNCMIIGDCV